MPGLPRCKATTPELHSFAAGVQKDKDAVRASEYWDLQFGCNNLPEILRIHDPKSPSRYRE